MPCAMRALAAATFAFSAANCGGLGSTAITGPCVFDAANSVNIPMFAPMSTTTSSGPISNPGRV